MQITAADEKELEMKRGDAPWAGGSRPPGQGLPEPASKSKQPIFVSQFDPWVRRAFFWRVFGLLIFQILCIAVLVIWATSNVQAQDYRPLSEMLDDNRVASALGSDDIRIGPRFQGHPYVLATAVGLTLLLMVLMSLFSDSLGRLFPLNLLLVALFSLASAYVLASIAETSSRTMVLNVMLLLSLMLLLLVIYNIVPCCDTWDYHLLWGTLFCIVFILVVVVCVVLTDPREFIWSWSWVHDERDAWTTAEDAAYKAGGFWIAVVAALVFSVYLHFTLWQQCKINEPCDYVAVAFAVNVNLALLIGLSLVTIMRVAQASFALCITCRAPKWHRLLK